jgi:hypothetical protein
MGLKAVFAKYVCAVNLHHASLPQVGDSVWSPGLDPQCLPNPFSIKLPATLGAAQYANDANSGHISAWPHM